MTTAAYEPQPYGAAENAVKPFKLGVKKACNTRATHSTTGETPFKLLFGREESTHFDRLKPSALAEQLEKRLAERIKNNLDLKQPKQRHFSENDKVMVKMFKGNKSFWQRTTAKSRGLVNRTNRSLKQNVPCK
ncbi:hypothetical protein Bhyg_16171 [Pseudolycoriella hygida]|uniref:Uncharacterized protein n=1 Tax=Pseudolycoriella hygida TaxID=35572 RepID=A0A9Q0RV75_9DIPT|nr:hypothetical protein Bhyg_16171 [Pseudolycoriella hygida]